MKTRSGTRQKAKPRLNTRIIYVVASATLLGVGGVLIFFYLNVGSPQTAQAAVTNISGVINSYLRVTAVNTSTRKFTADNLSGSIADFATGKTVMIYQAKGATITTSNSSSYGTVSSYNKAGNYEFATISGISGSGPYTITVAALINSYSASSLQLISVPTYTDASVTGTVKATDWDATNGRGGVVALQVTNTLKLGANIDVSGQGFDGGVAGGSNGNCPDNTTYHTTDSNYGAKGEGGSTDGDLYAMGAQMNGGGGGNPHNAGGGGGGNHTYGGNGGQGYQPGGSCAVLNAGGIGGKKIAYSSLTNKAFFGGGGGAGEQNNGLASSGASGGGLIVVRAKTVKSTCGATYGFIADGASAANSSGNDGAGGGGGGGSIILDVTNYVLTCNITVRANGGNGGSVIDPASHGGGGGAGVGIIMETNPTTNSKVALVSTIGTNGTDCSTCTGATGSPAETPTTSKMSITSIPGGVAALPIKLLYFNGSVAEEGVELNWATSMEENNDYFTVERSFDGVKFDSILTVPGAGNSKEKLNYAALDKAIFSSTTYYKLKQTDYDKRFTYSNVIYVDTHELQKKDVTLFPNPASNDLNIINPQGGVISIQILNSSGTAEYQQESNEIETKIDISSLNNGVYIVQTVVQGKKQNQRLVIKH